MPATKKRSKKPRFPPEFAAWIAIRRRLHLSHEHVQMARELKFDPERLPSMASVRDQPWKMPLQEYIEHLYRKRFRRDQPLVVITIEEAAAQQGEKKVLRRDRRAAERAAKELAASDSAPSDLMESPDDSPEDNKPDDDQADDGALDRVT